jgi:hypothetical protein
MIEPMQGFAAATGRGGFSSVRSLCRVAESATSQ